MVAVSPGKYHPFVGFNGSGKIYNHSYIDIHHASNLPAKMYLSTRSVLTGSISVFVCICKAQYSECPKSECQAGRFTKPKKKQNSKLDFRFEFDSLPPPKNKLDWICTVYTLLPTWKIGLELQTLSWTIDRRNLHLLLV